MPHAKLQSLKQMLSPEQVVIDPIQLFAYEVDANLMDRALPDGVVLPRSVDDVVRLAQWAAQHQVPLVARAAGTGLAGGAVAHQGELVVAFSQMSRVLDFDEAGRSATVQPNVVNQKFAELAASHGLYFPPDPASGRTSTIGGNIGTNAGGPHCFKYGVTTNYVTGMQVVLAGGRLMHVGGRALDIPEYDFTGLLVGSEGTLGLITAAHLRLIRQPPGVKTMMAAFDSVEEAGQAVSAIIARGLVPATLEMMDRQIMRIIEDFNQPGLPVDSAAALILDVDGYPTSLASQIEEISRLLKDEFGCELRIANTEDERAKIWYGRKSAAGALSRLAPAYYLVDGTVPRSLLAQTLHEINQLCQTYNVQVGYVFHAGDGNLHPLILIPDPHDDELVQRVYRTGKEMIKLCVEKDGSLTGEHGVGLEKRDYMPLMYNPAELSAMQDIKTVFDPDNLMNPGKVLPPNISPPQLPSPPATGPTFPFAPTSADEAAEALRFWSLVDSPASLRICGNGTKLNWLPATEQIISTRKLNGIKTVARDDFYITAGAGTPLAELQQELAQDNMWVPLVTPWRSATLGGTVAANFNTPLRTRYGAIRDLLLATTVALPDGRIIRAGRPVVKNVAGYDLPKLFVGSQGTLGLMTDLTLKIAPRPRARASLVVPVENLGDGMAWGQALLPHGLVTSALLLMRSHNVPGVQTPFALIFTAEGLPEDVAQELAEVRAALKSQGAPQPEAVDFLGNDLWAEWISQRTIAGTLLRVGVPVSQLTNLVGDSTVSHHAFVVDLANGMLYLRGEPDVAAVRRVANRLGGYSVILGGPVGRYTAAEVWGHTPESLDLMRTLKRRWDKRGFLNAGVFLV